MKIDEFRRELTKLINKYSIENYCDMPDFLMSEMVCGLIKTIGIKSKQNLDWHGCDSICHPKKKESICDTAPFPKCNGANGCDTCEHQPEE